MSEEDSGSTSQIAIMHLVASCPTFNLRVFYIENRGISGRTPQPGIRVLFLHSSSQLQVLAHLLSVPSIPRQAGDPRSHFTELFHHMAKLGSWESNSQFRSLITDQPQSYGEEEIESFDTVPLCLLHCRRG